MQTVSQYLRQPYPYPEGGWKAIIVVSLSIFAILVVFQPFGIESIDAGKKIWALAGYAVVTALVMGVQYYLPPLLFPRYHNERRWTVGKHIVSNIVTLMLIATGNMIYGYVFNITWQRIDIEVFLSALLITVAVGIFPIVLTTILQQNRFLSISLREAAQLNDSLGVRQSGNDKVISLSGTGKDDLLEISVLQLLYMEACGNYVKVYYLKNNTPAQKMLRSTIKQMEDQADSHPFIIKCHRAFLVNLEAVQQMNGNSQGYRLRLNGSEDEVPVSRAYTSAVKTKIRQLTA
ncbi:MAG: LytTR family transcriptional regulator [Tannerellaceae bacterium]|jgi:DNA-binding LytR/AlgR family response regulator|nr:LytTR family transcriptional regulator [Tannerellaceae bacterium]